jgi:hypothetical protein
VPNALLEPGERWGWEYRLGAELVTTEPAARQDGSAPEADWARAAADRYARAAAVRRRHWWIGPSAVVVAVVLAAVWPVAPMLVAAAAVLALGVVSALVVLLPPVRASRAADAACLAWLRGYRVQMPERAAPVARCAGRWRPVRVQAAERVDVYGGTGRGRSALLSTVAGSVLGSGGSVTVLDLTGESAVGELIRVAGAAGHRLDLLSLPDHLPSVGLLTDLAPAQVGTVLADAVHAVDRDPDTGDRSGDAALVVQAATALRYQGAETRGAETRTGNGFRPLTFRRLAAALRALEGAEPMNAALSAAEQANLASVRRSVATMAAGPRLRRLCAAAGQLAAAEEQDVGVRPYRDPHAQLRVMQLLSTEDTELLAQVLAGVLLHQVRRQVSVRSGDEPAGPARLLVVVGADGLRRALLEKLETLTSRRGIRLVLAYRRLRPDAGTPGKRQATILLRQENDTAAAQAAALVGEHPLLAAEAIPDAGPLDASRPGVGASAGRLPDAPPLPPVPEHPTAPAPEAEPRPGVRYLPTAGFFRALPDTAAVLLDPRDAGSPRLVDYAPPTR